jgi:UPF0755 protein
MRSMESLESEGFHTFNMKNKKLYIAVVLLVVLVIFPLSSLFYYKTALNRPAQGHKEATFEIIEGESVSSIAKRLLEDELINSQFLFKAHVVSKGLHTKIQAGIYRVSAGSSVAELSDMFQHGTNDIRITFLEGWRVEEYARAAAQTFRRVDYTEFLTLAIEKEGFLFPDTYFFNVDVSEEEIVDTLTETFREKTKLTLKEKKLVEAGFTLEEAVIFGSLVEREISDDEDRPVVAGIIIKRWQEGGLLGVDATTQYSAARLKVCNPITAVVCPTVEEAMIIDWWPEELSSEDLAWDSPYNTRKNAGLPPKPIANPGLSALEAVMNYTETPYRYYLTDENGITHYAVTLEEHNRNVSQHL